MNAFLRVATTQGDALRDLVAHYAGEGSKALDSAGRMYRSGHYRQIAFAGMGASFCAPFAILDYLADSGIAATALTATDLSRRRAVLITADTLVVMTSQSGGTSELLDLVTTLGGEASLILLVNRAGSKLAGHGKLVLPIRAGEETQVATRSYLCTLALLNLLAAEFVGASRPALLDQLGAIARWAIDYLTTPSHSEAALAALAGATHIDVLGSGPSFSTAYKAGLVFREAPNAPVAVLDCADYSHGWERAVRPGYVGLVLAPDYHESSVERRAVGRIMDRGGRVILVTGGSVPQSDLLFVLTHPALPERLAPLAQTVICDALIGSMIDLSPP